MDAKRANEIVHSKTKVDVLYTNELVWLESVNEKRNVAEIRKLSNGELILVSLDDLFEKAPEI